MARHLALLSAAALLTAAAQAQCFTAGTGSTVGLVAWDIFDSYGSFYDADDEGITSPPIAFTAFPSFPMAGAVGTLNQMWVNSNGEIYLTDSSLALTEPVDGAAFGADSLDEFRGLVSGASARIVAFGNDCEGSTVGGAAWNIKVDQTVAGQVRVTWTDMARYGTPGDQFSFSCTLFSNGAVQLSYGPNIPQDFQFAGLSIGNMVGSPTSPSRDLQNADSGTEGLLYEDLSTGWDLSDATILIVPNGLGGYSSSQVCGPAFHATYGSGCYGPTATQAFYQLFGSPAAAASLTGNSMTLTPTANGYVAVWGGGTYVAPTMAATTLTLADDDDVDVIPSAAFPTPTGPVGTLSVCSNGFVNMGPSGINFVWAYGDVFELLNTTIPAFRSNADYDPSSSPSGAVKTEEAGGVLYVTFENIERYGTTGVSDRFQFQLDLASGTCTYVWDSMQGTVGGDLLVGYSPSGSEDAGSIDLATALPLVTSPDYTGEALALSASPAPVFSLGNPSVPITYTVDNIVDVVPPLGIGIAALIFSVAPIPGGLDLGFLGMPGCNLNIASLDVFLTMPGGTAPTDSITFAVPQPLAPGLSFYSQALSLFTPNSLPNGQNPFGGIMSNGLQSSFNTF